LIYDCFAVSNHFGNVGFGHYTAFAKNPLNNEWYNFDDSRCSQVNSRSQIVSSSAYSLFYRLRDGKNLAKIDYEEIE